MYTFLKNGDQIYDIMKFIICQEKNGSMNVLILMTCLWIIFSKL